MFIAVSAFTSSSVWPRNSTGVSPRVPLYSGSSSVLKLCLETSNATHMCVGFSPSRMFNIMEINP